MFHFYKVENPRATCADEYLQAEKVLLELKEERRTKAGFCNKRRSATRKSKSGSNNAVTL